MPQQEFTIVNKLGLHARASALFVKTASQFGAEVKVGRDGVEVNGKSIMGIMMLAAAKGTVISVTTSGADEQEALRVLGELIVNGFGED